MKVFLYFPIQMRHACTLTSGSANIHRQSSSSSSASSSSPFAAKLSSWKSSFSATLEAKLPQSSVEGRSHQPLASNLGKNQKGLVPSNGPNMSQPYNRPSGTCRESCLVSAVSNSGKLRYSAMKLARSMPLAVPFSRSTPFTSSSSA